MARPRKNAVKTQNTLLTTNEVVVIPVEEQPYPLPEGWKWVKLEKLYQINPRIIADDNTMASFVPMEKIEPGMKGTFTFEILPWGKAKKGHTQFADGDVAFAKISPCFENGKSMLVHGLKNGIGAGTTELIILRQPSVLQKYTFYLICSSDFIQKGTHTYSGTVGQQRISMDFVRNYPVPLPPLDEQQRIVGRIESLFVKLDEAREKAEAVLDGFESRKAAILHKAFTGELTEKWREERCLKKENNIIKIKTILSDIKYGTSEKSDYTYTGLPVIRIPNITGSTVNLDDLKFLKSSKSSDYDLVKRNDILMIRSNGSRELVGKCALVDDAIVGKAYASYLIRLRPKPIINAKYLLSFLSSSLARNQLFAKAKSSAGINNINSKEICSVDIWLPHKGEQQEIVRILDSLLAKEQRAKESAEIVLEQIELMKKAILARAFRGELTG